MHPPIQLFFQIIVFLAISIGLTPSAKSQTPNQPVIVFAAASLKESLEEISKAYLSDGGSEIRFSFASSSILAKQIEAGSPADIFASADTKWMDYLESKNQIARDTRTHLLGNTLVIIAPADVPIENLALDEKAISSVLGESRIATGDIQAVPAGIYAKSALQQLGLWTALKDRLAQTDNVRVALSLVARKEAALGIVYATDARIQDDVKVIATFPQSSHEPIIYPFALTATHQHPEALKFLDYLKGPTAKAIFEKAGFPVLAP